MKRRLAVHKVNLNFIMISIHIPTVKWKLTAQSMLINSTKKCLPENEYEHDLGQQQQHLKSMCQE